MRKLSSRELEVVKYAAAGYKAKEIARIIGIEYRTIETYMISLKRKLEARTIAHAVFLACKKNIIVQLQSTDFIE